MPELAEVDYYRRVWNPGIGLRILRVETHHQKRVFRSLDHSALLEALTGSEITSSESHGKQMLFRLRGHGWLGIHLGMTGELRIEPPTFEPGTHDHLALYQRRHALVFGDPRQFGRIRFHQGTSPPEWWSNLPPALTGPEFTQEWVRSFLARRARAPIKSVLLMQEGFPGVGNWMADEALWLAGVNPRRRSGRLTPMQSVELYRAIRKVAFGALRVMQTEFRDPPPSWLFRHRWQPGGLCPRHALILKRSVIGGRATAWCSLCQPA